MRCRATPHVSSLRPEKKSKDSRKEAQKAQSQTEGTFENFAPSRGQTSRVESDEKNLEALWDALCHEGEEPTSPDWHENILKDRSSKIASGQATFLSLVEAKKRIEG